MIADKEFNALFRQESREHLDAMEIGILALESENWQPDILHNVMREAHSLKGAARMLELETIEALSHELESKLVAELKNEGLPSSTPIQELLHCVDQLRHLCQLAVDGESSPPPSRDTPNIDIATATESVDTLPTATDHEHSLIQRFDSIRVATETLDKLMAQSSELQMLEKRIANQWSLVDDLSSMFDESMRMHGSMLEQVERVANSHDIKSLQTLISSFTELLTDMNNSFSTYRELEAQNTANLQNLSARLDDNVRKLRMMPLSVLFDQFSRMIRDLSSDLGKPVNIIIDGADLMMDKRVIEELKDPLMHLIRNAIEHGIEMPPERRTANKPEAGMIKLRGISNTSSVMIEVEDDGRGLNVESIKAKALKMQLVDEQQLDKMSEDQIFNLIFSAGLSTQEKVSDISGRGVGMDVVKTAVARLKGEIIINSQVGSGTGFRLAIPQNFATTRVVLVRVKGQIFALPMSSIHYLLCKI